MFWKKSLKHKKSEGKHKQDRNLTKHMKVTTSMTKVKCSIQSIDSTHMLTMKNTAFLHK